MGEAKKRGTQEQRIQSAAPKKPKMSAAERDRWLMQETRAIIARTFSRLGIK